MSVPTADTLRRLAGALREQGGLLADAVRDGDVLAVPAGDPNLGALAAAGRRSACHTDDVAFVIEAIREGYLLHYGAGRLLHDDDPDLVLLAGDHLYALGLARLAALGDLEAIVELADVISLGAQAHAEGRPELAEAVWEAGAAAVGWGADDALRAAKGAARDGAADAPGALRAAARRLRGDTAPVR